MGEESKAAAAGPAAPAASAEFEAPVIRSVVDMRDAALKELRGADMTAADVVREFARQTGMDQINTTSMNGALNLEGELFDVRIFARQPDMVRQTIRTGAERFTLIANGDQFDRDSFEGKATIDSRNRIPRRQIAQAWILGSPGLAHWHFKNDPASISLQKPEGVGIQSVRVLENKTIDGLVLEHHMDAETGLEVKRIVRFVNDEDAAIVGIYSDFRTHGSVMIPGRVDMFTAGENEPVATFAVEKWSFNSGLLTSLFEVN